VNAREAAYFALLGVFQGKNFIAPFLEEWQHSFKPSERDFRLAQEMAMGTCRMALALDVIGEQLSSKHKLKLKLKEKVLLRLALYQACMMDRIPLHAVVNETVELAKKHGMGQKARFFNALLRKLETHTFEALFTSASLCENIAANLWRRSNARYPQSGQYSSDIDGEGAEKTV
jgi:16S rRNA (cytosine967-C5)-methyltransferase